MKTRNYCFDCIKVIAAFMVICLHSQYPDGILGEMIKSVARAGVPFFFMISGYYTWNESNSYKKCRKALIKHIKIIALVYVVYITYYSLPDLKRFILPTAIKDTVFNFEWLLSNIGLVGHMWFIRALIYIDIVMILFGSKIQKLRIIWILLPIWIIDVIMFKYSIVFFGVAIPQPFNEIITKYVCNGFLYYYVGFYLHSNKEKVENYISKIKMSVHIIIIILLAFFCVIEFIILDVFFVNTMPVNYFFTMPFSICLFLFGMRFHYIGQNSIIAWIGVNVTMYIYYWHILIIQIVMRFVPRDCAVYVNNPVAIFIISAIFGCLIVYLKKVIFNKQYDLLK